MTEAERLREILGLVRHAAEEALKVNPHHDILCYRQEHSVTSGDCDCWRKYCHMAIDTINKALTAKPEVCVWTRTGNEVISWLETECGEHFLDDRPHRVSWTKSQGRYYAYCPGCGARIEVAS